MLQINNISKSFPGKDAIKNINISVKEGTIMGLIGPNGAGKSTLLRTIVDIYKPDNGEVTVNGENVSGNSKIKELIGYVGDKYEYFQTEKIKNIIKYYKLAYPNFDTEKFHELNKVFQIPLNQKLSKLSKGNAARVAFMMTLSCRPKLLILDEPTSGLDPIIKRKFLNILMEDVAERKTTVVISSHNLHDLESICDQVVFLNNGQVIQDNSLDNLKTSIKKLQIIFKEMPPENFDKWPEFIKVEKVGRSFNVITKEYNDELAAKLKDSDVLFIEELNLSLEDMLIYTIEK